MSRDAAFQYLDANQSRFVDELMKFLAIPSISAHPERDAAVLEAMEFDKRKLESLGFRTEVWPTRSHAGLFAERIEDPSLPTVLIYGHVDVQPVDPENLWTTPPFTPEIRDGAIWARGADDNKGQHYAQIAGVESVLKTAGRLPVNVKFIIESDEEFDGEAITLEFPKKLEQLRCDVFVVADCASPGLDHPAICTTLRGIVTADFTITGAKGDLHSGEWGGMTYEPIDVMRWVLQNLKDYKSGKVLVPGFYDDVIAPSPEERAAMAAGPWKDDVKAKEIGVARLFAEEGFTAREAGTLRPTLQVNGIQGGYTGKGFKTVIGNQVMAKVSMRLVHNQNGEKIYKAFQKYVLELVGDKGTVTFGRYGDGRPFRAELNDPFVKAGLAAMEAGFGKPAVVYNMGGSIPIVAPLVEATGARCVMMGFGLPGDNLHAPNEHFHLASFLGGSRAAAAYLYEVAARIGAPASA
jgi:acetylornithine deacetylase/succinyl-diaminopimelate desuccinylase-like protein